MGYDSTVMKNRYRGECRACQKHVAAGEGFYESGWLVCSEIVWRREAPEALHQFIVIPLNFSCLNQLNEKAGTAFESAQAVWQAMEAERVANMPTPEEIEANKAAMELAEKELRKRRREELKKLKEENICPRCDGKGGSSAWFATGWTCHRCFGSGKYFN